MKGKLLFVAGLGVGYVLGTRAGRKRYEQIVGAVQKVWETDGVQTQVHTAQDFIADKIGDIPGLVFAGIGKAANSLAARRRRVVVTVTSVPDAGRPAASAEESSDA